MTIKIPPKPEPGILDKILKFFGRERQLLVPDDVYEKYGPYCIVQARWEGFWRCLLRRKGKDRKTAEEFLAEVEGKGIKME